MTDSIPEPAKADAPRAPRREWLSTPAGKVGVILLLLLGMQIPHFMVSGLIHDRQERQSEVLAAFRRGWGPEQTVGGPLLIVPYSWTGSEGERLHGWARLAASRLNVAVDLQPEARHRGLFQAIVYTASVALSGTMAVPPLVIPDHPDAEIDWHSARVVVGASDLRATPADPTITWNGSAVPLHFPVQAGCTLQFLEAAVGFQAAPAAGTVIAFRSALTLRGTQAFHLVPTARQIDMSIASSWPTPDFTGATLPVAYHVRPNGFDAHWDVTGDPASSDWQTARGCWAPGNATWTNPDAQVGVTLQQAVPTYLMVDRAAKYGVLFLVLSYSTMFLFELLFGEKIHLVQYGLVGLSLSLFALLLIAIAEPLGFTAAYGLSAAAVVAQASLYMASVVGRRRLAIVFAGLLAALFLLLYIILIMETYALLAGTLVLFVALSVLMAATRRVNWAATPGGA